MKTGEFQYQLGRLKSNCVVPSTNVLQQQDFLNPSTGIAVALRMIFTNLRHLGPLLTRAFLVS
jgi:hypothetical protein